MADRGITGLNEAMRALRRLPEGIAEKGGGGPLRKGMAAGARKFRDAAAQNLSGRGLGVKNDRTEDLRLKDSIIARRDPDADEKGFTERYVVGPRAKAFWGLFVERGTEKQPARPFLAPAFESEKNAVVDVIASTIRNRMDALVRKAKQG